MAFDKEKTLAAAQKFQDRGQYEKAIREYNKVLEAEPNDDRTMLSLDFTPVGGLDEDDENDDDEEEMEQEENLSSDLRESLPLGSEADDALDDTIDNPVTLPTHTDTLSS